MPPYKPLALLLSALSLLTYITSSTLHTLIMAKSIFITDIYFLWWKGGLSDLIEGAAPKFGNTMGMSAEGGRRALSSHLGHYVKHMAFFMGHVFAVIPWLFWPVQFSKTIRRKYIDVHRNLGRLILLSMIPVTITGLYLGMVSNAKPVAATWFISISQSTYVTYQCITGYLALKRTPKNIPLHQLCMTRLTISLMTIPATRVSLVIQTMLMYRWYGPVADDDAVRFIQGELGRSFWMQEILWLVIGEGYAMWWRWSRGYGVWGEKWGKGGVRGGAVKVVSHAQKVGKEE
ncbi:hypothetical protein HDV00_009746 [Rhizophlyctis rosea]|nr:hypothetical protein HDV00_009746 [Rhizophlyctis rosea]